MSCSLGVLAIALQLATGLVAAPENPNRGLSHMIDAVCRGCYCAPGNVTAADNLRCEANALEYQEARFRQRAADYREFRRLTAMCSDSVDPLRSQLSDEHFNGQLFYLKAPTFEPGQ